VIINDDEVGAVLSSSDGMAVIKVQAFIHFYQRNKVFSLN